MKILYSLDQSCLSYRFVYVNNWKIIVNNKQIIKWKIYIFCITHESMQWIYDMAYFSIKIFVVDLNIYLFVINS